VGRSARSGSGAARRTEVAGAALARNWGAIALRGIAAVAFGLGVLALPPPTLASLVLLFAAYVVADGVFAILAGARAGSQPERWWTLILEGATNLAAAGAVLVWAAIAVVPLLSLASAWAIVTGALMLAAAHRYSGASGRWLLAFGGGVSAGWGALAVALAPAVGGDLRTAELWLVAYALVFGVTLLVLASGLRRRHIGPEQPST
jgi:uncharacterized membrane protein HdeD (DUF308 family)